MASRPRAYLLCCAFISVFRGMRKRYGEAGGAGVLCQISLTERASCVLFTVTRALLSPACGGSPSGSARTAGHTRALVATVRIWQVGDFPRPRGQVP